MTFIGSLYSPVKRKSLPQRNVDGIEHKLQSLSEFKLSFSYTAGVDGCDDAPAAASTSCCDFTCIKKNKGLLWNFYYNMFDKKRKELHYNAISICHLVV